MSTRSDEDARQLAANLAFIVTAHRDRLRKDHKPEPPLLRTLEDLLRSWGNTAGRGSPAAQWTSAPVLALSLEETAGALGLGLRTVEKLVADGEIPSLLVGGSRRVRTRALEDYLRRREAETTRRPADRRPSPQIQIATAPLDQREVHAHHEPPAPTGQRSA